MKYDNLYDQYQNMKESQKQQNFDAIMSALDKQLTTRLDETFSVGAQEEYDKMLSNIKARGIKVFRNSEGKHKLKFI